jgi:hypothetical protein
MSKLVMVETVSQFFHRYVIELPDDYNNICAEGLVAASNAEEMSQRHIGESILSSREITEDEYMTMFDKDNDYLINWTDDQKKSLINVKYNNEQTGVDDGA